MINVIVNLYRGMIGFAFFIGIALAVIALAINAGGQGPLAALVIIAITGAGTGVSALLISINDHLAALRER